MDIITMILACSLYSDNSVVNAMLQTGSNDNPWVVSGKPFKTQAQALAYAQSLKAQDEPFTVGLMQIPDRWLKDQPVSLNELLRPCKNMVAATQILNQIASQQCNGDMACTLSVYKTGDAQAGADYATQIMTYAQSHPFTPPPSKE